VGDTVTCERCRTNATVLRHVYKPEELAEIARLLPAHAPVAPYMIIHCPNCGTRGVDSPLPPVPIRNLYNRLACDSLSSTCNA
jgi:hypothetical protein